MHTKWNKKLSCRRTTARCCVSLNISLSFKVTQGHSKWHDEAVCKSLSLSVYLYLVPFLRYLAFNNGVTLKSGLRSLKIIQSGTIQKPRYDFLFGFHNNYGPILNRFRHKSRDWSKIAIFSYTPAFAVRILPYHLVRKNYNGDFFLYPTCI